MIVDVCIVTKNPEKVLGLIEKLRKSSFVNKIIIETSIPLGLARMRAIRKVSTEWFLFLDDDIIIPNIKK